MIAFAKGHGLGNDYIVLDEKDLPRPLDQAGGEVQPLGGHAALGQPDRPEAMADAGLQAPPAAGAALEHRGQVLEQERRAGEVGVVPGDVQEGDLVVEVLPMVCRTRHCQPQ